MRIEHMGNKKARFALEICNIEMIASCIKRTARKNAALARSTKAVGRNHPTIKAAAYAAGRARKRYHRAHHTIREVGRWEAVFS
jgi:hypothetical protein